MSKNYLPILVAVIGLVGVILGAFVNYFASSNLQSANRSKEIRIQAYSDFISSQHRNPIRNSTVRVAIFSPKEVAISFSNWLSITGLDECRQADLRAILDLHHAMRRDAFDNNPDEELDDFEMALLVYGCLLPR